MIKVQIDVSYAQIAVFDAEMSTPLNDWTAAHVAQGFSWRPGSVSFGTLLSSASATVEVLLNKPLVENASRAARIIVVPFFVPVHGSIEIASVAGGVAVSLPPGNYELTFEHGEVSGRRIGVRFRFRLTGEAVVARIIRADPGLLSPPRTLVMEAKSAS
jgi:hypothetical protein